MVDDSESTIIDGIEYIKRFDIHTKPFCVLGVLKTQNGLSIEREMLMWLTKSFDVYSVRQEPPGELFEYPALKFMKELCERKHCYCLYLHTKGAANGGKTQRRIRNMWRYEIEHNIDAYIKPLDSDDPVVTTQLTGERMHTWYNMFFANESAMRTVDLSRPNSNRMVYEYLFRNSPTKIIGTYSSDVTTAEQRHIYRDKLLNEHGGDSY